MLLWLGSIACVADPPADKPIGDITTAAGSLVATPATLTFPETDRGATSPATLTLTNAGTAPIDILSVGVAGEGAAFSITDGAIAGLEVGDSAELLVAFSPEVIGESTGTLEMETSDPADPTFRVPLSGTGHGADLDLSPTSIDLGDVVVGCTVETLLTADNRGDRPLTITAIAVTEAPAELRLGDTDLPWTLLPGASSQVSISYGPLQHAEDGGTIAVYSDDPVDPIVEVVLHGSGVIEDARTDHFVQGTPSTLDLLVALGDVSESDESVAAAALTRYANALAGAQIDFHLSILDNSGCHAGDLSRVDADMSDEERAAEITTAAGNANRSGADQAMWHILNATANEGDGFNNCNVGFFRNGAPLALLGILPGADTTGTLFATYRDEVYDFAGGIENVVAHAITPPSGGCDHLDENDDWEDLVDDTEGVFHSYCDTDWNGAMDSISDRTYGRRGWFELTAVPVVSTIEVTVGWNVLQSGWSYDAAENMIRFEESTLPDSGDEIDIAYALAPSTCD